MSGKFGYSNGFGRRVTAHGSELSPFWFVFYFLKLTFDFKYKYQ